MSGPAGAGPRTSGSQTPSAATGEPPRPAPLGPGPPGPAAAPLCPRRKQEPHPRYRTTNQTYGSRAPTLHEVPTSFHVTPHGFTRIQGMGGPYRNSGLNTALEKSHVTGPDNFITAHDHLDFHPSYNPNGPSHC